MRITKIGSWSKDGKPVDWHYDVGIVSEHDDFNFYGAILTIQPDGRVFVDRVEIVEWTQARREAMEKKP